MNGSCRVFSFMDILRGRTRCVEATVFYHKKNSEEPYSRSSLYQSVIRQVLTFYLVSCYQFIVITGTTHRIMKT